MAAAPQAEFGRRRGHGTGGGQQWPGCPDAPRVDKFGYGLRVPALVISPYARRGYIDHQTLSFDAYLKFIEDDFLHGRRIDPRTDGRPDPRPDVRENARILGDLVSDFDFHQKPRPWATIAEHRKMVGVTACLRKTGASRA